MTILYNCHTDGTEYRITKFSDGNVESSYLCSTDECQCPAGHRHTCRHRMMLPLFINRGAVNTFWFLDYERKGWVSNESAPLRFDMDYSNSIGNSPAFDTLGCERSELGSQQDERSIAYEISLPDDASPDEVAEAFSGLLRSKPHSPTVTTTDFDSVDDSSILSVAASKPSWRRI